MIDAMRHAGGGRRDETTREGWQSAFIYPPKLSRALRPTQRPRLPPTYLPTYLPEREVVGLTPLKAVIVRCLSTMRPARRLAAVAELVIVAVGIDQEREYESGT